MGCKGWLMLGLDQVRLAMVFCTGPNWSVHTVPYYISGEPVWFRPNFRKRVWTGSNRSVWYGTGPNRLRSGMVPVQSGLARFSFSFSFLCCWMKFFFWFFYYRYDTIRYGTVLYQSAISMGSDTESVYLEAYNIWNPDPYPTQLDNVSRSFDSFPPMSGPLDTIWSIWPIT